MVGGSRRVCLVLAAGHECGAAVMKVLKTLALPFLVTLLIDIGVVVLAVAVGNRFDDHDMGMLAATGIDILGGLAAGMAGVLTWIWRNR